MRLGEALLANGIINSDQLRIGLQEKRQHGRPLGLTLIQLGFTNDGDVRDALAQTLNLGTVNLKQVHAEPVAMALLPAALARQVQCLPYALDSTHSILHCAMAQPSANNLARLHSILPSHIRLQPHLCGDDELAHAIEQHYGGKGSLDELIVKLEQNQEQGAKNRGSNEESIVRLVDELLNEAAEQQASDVHLEPEVGFVRIRYRLDGLLAHVRSLHGSLWPAMLVRIKVLAGMNIAETRCPQNGRFSIRHGNHTIDCRAATHPTLHGENLVLRLLDRQRGVVKLDQLGLPAHQIRRLETIIARPEGLILVTGPTGSGKTTTLYALLHQLDAHRLNIMTLEDPVEYPISGFRQTSLTETVKLDFASGIRSLLRQDPDVILVGEIRDTETAQMAIRAAMTGHQVYATLHANSALMAFLRLQELGLNPAQLSGNVTGIIAQRLVRRLCVHCREPEMPDEDQVNHAPSAVPAHGGTYRPSGCPRCRHSGYQGRFPLMEILPVSEELDDLFIRNAGRKQIRQYLQQIGHSDLAAAAQEAVLAGITSAAEITRIIGKANVESGQS